MTGSLKELDFKINPYGCFLSKKILMVKNYHTMIYWWSQYVLWVTKSVRYNSINIGMRIDFSMSVKLKITAVDYINRVL